MGPEGGRPRDDGGVEDVVEPPGATHQSLVLFGVELLLLRPRPLLVAVQTDVELGVHVLHGLKVSAGFDERLARGPLRRLHLLVAAGEIAPKPHHAIVRVDRHAGWTVRLPRR